MATPFDLTYGLDIRAKVIATNIKGDSLESAIGQGATVISKPDPPVSLIEDISLRTTSTLGIEWSDGASDGGSPILEYKISIEE
jgi:hypothetical protein